jgi:hypothetical protein
MLHVLTSLKQSIPIIFILQGLAASVQALPNAVSLTDSEIKSIYILQSRAKAVSIFKTEKSQQLLSRLSIVLLTNSAWFEELQFEDSCTTISALLRSAAGIDVRSENFQELQRWSCKRDEGAFFKASLKRLIEHILKARSAVSDQLIHDIASMTLLLKYAPESTDWADLLCIVGHAWVNTSEKVGGNQVILFTRSFLSNLVGSGKPLGADELVILADPLQNLASSCIKWLATECLLETTELDIIDLHVYVLDLAIQCLGRSGLLEKKMADLETEIKNTPSGDIKTYALISMWTLMSRYGSTNFDEDALLGLYDMHISKSTKEQADKFTNLKWELMANLLPGVQGSNLEKLLQVSLDKLSLSTPSTGPALMKFVRLCLTHALVAVPEAIVNIV